MKATLIRRLLILNFVLVSSLFLDNCQKEINPLINDFYQDLSAKNSYIAIQGTEHFFFLPPLASMPSLMGTFAGNLEPVVQICRWTGTGCEFPPIVEFTTTTGRGSERVRVVPEDELYIVNWHTKSFKINPTETYRIRVLVRIQEKVSIEIELGHLDVKVKVKGETIPIKFRIEEGYSPIGELTSQERAKISPVLLMQFLSKEVVEPVEALVNVFDDQFPIPELNGVEILKDYRPTLAKVFARISDPATLASLVKLNNIKYVYENRKWYPVSFPWQESIGQNLVQQSGYIGTGTAVVILDDGGKKIGAGGDLPKPRILDLSVSAFGCTDVGTPAGCRVVDEENPYWGDPWISNHATYVARRIAETSPGTGIIAWDIVFEGVVEGDVFSEAIAWVLNHRVDYNIVALNMSFSTDADGSPAQGPYSTQDCPTGDDQDFQRLRQAGIMPIAAAGNDGYWQTSNNSFLGIGHPACSPYVVSVGGTTSQGMIWEDGTRGPNLDLLAPAEQEDGAPGTSLSSPTVAGAWAVLRAALPNLNLDETLELLKVTGSPVYDGKSSLTFPLIQVDAALSAAGLSIMVYNNGEPYFVYDDHGGISSKAVAVGHLISADDFTLSVAKHVTGASVDVYDGPADQNKRWDGTVEWWLFNNNGNLPGNLIASGIGENIVQRNIEEDPLGFRDFTVDFDFDQEIPLPAGQIFWFALHMRVDYSQVSVFWYCTESTLLNNCRVGGEIIGGVPNFVDGQYAHDSSKDVAFRIKGH